jgi:hypothetical protein
MAGILTLTVLNSKKIKESLDTAFSSEEKLIAQLMDDESKLIEFLGINNDSQNLVALKAILRVPFLTL